MIKKKLIDLLAGSRKYVAFQVLWMWLSLLCQIAVVSIAARLLEGALYSRLEPDSLLPYGLAVAALLALRLVFDRRATAASHAASVDVKRTVRERIYAKLLRLGASYREHVSSSELVQMSVEGAEQLETYFGRYLSQLFYSVLAALTLFVYLLPYSWQASLVLLVCVPLIPVVIILIQKIASRLLDRYWDSYAELGDSFLENLQGLTTLKIYQADERKAQEMDAESERFRKATMRVLMMQLNSIIVMDIIAYGGAAAGMIIALSQFLAGELSLSGALVICLLAAEFFIPMRLLGSFFHIAMNGMAASDRMFAFLELPEPEAGTEELPDGPVDIAFEGVRFSYEQGREILKGIDLEFSPGSLTSLVGSSGCGKSTVANIVTGRNKGYGGQVRIGGRELSSVAEASLMRHVTLVSNKSYLFKGTVADNLRMAAPDASDQELHQVLAQVNLDAYLKTQEGLATQLAEEGANLSGGQRQRLAIARALLHDSACYIFDEATSNIDVESEETIMEVVHRLAKTKTVILVSHRLANVVGSDRVYYLEGGTVAESGTHEELMARSGAYAQLYTAQGELEAFGRKGA